MRSATILVKAMEAFESRSYSDAPSEPDRESGNPQRSKSAFSNRVSLQTRLPASVRTSPSRRERSGFERREHDRRGQETVSTVSHHSSTISVPIAPF
jgi:hypothetical protein